MLNYYFYGMDPGYLLLILVSTVLGLGAELYIKKTYRTWSNVPSTIGESGKDVARAMLDAGGASDVGIVPVGGTLTDFYDPRDNDLHLSNDNYQGGTVASVAVACHEAGHAIQHACGYVPMKMRAALVPVVNFTSNIWALVLFAGFFLNMAGLVKAAIVLFAFTVIFQLVTLPVEIDASRRAVRYLAAHGGGIDERGAREVLVAAALTYVASALVSIMQLLYLIGRNDDR